MLLSLLPLLGALHAPRGVPPRGVPPRVASVRCEGVRASAAPLPLLVCTTAPSLEGMAFCREALASGEYCLSLNVAPPLLPYVRDLIVRNTKTSGEYRVRALTRNPSSPRAAALEEMGAELCVADNLDPTSLRAAFEGAQASPPHTRHILSMRHKHTHTHTHTPHLSPPSLFVRFVCADVCFVIRRGSMRSPHGAGAPLGLTAPSCAPTIWIRSF